LTVDRDMLLAGLKRLMAFTSSMSYQVVFELTGQKLKITASDPNFGNEAEETMEILYSGQDNLKASFNIKYFIELLQNIDSEEVIIAFGDVNDNFVTNKAVVIKPENDATKANITMLLMPMIL
jgi:DNA polymerase III sliding clamp (beta) subunit (PCNA family)